MSGWSISASDVSAPPCTTFRMPLGKPDPCATAKSKSDVSGVCGDGLRTNVFPAAIAIGNIQSGIIAGKLNGVIPTQTPSGYRIETESMPRATSASASPIMSDGIPQANSTASMPRRTSARASVKRLAVFARDRERDLVAPLL